MPIQFGSINTGLPPNIVEQMMEAERIPIKNIQAKKEKSEAQLKLVEELTNKVSDIRKGLGELANTRGFSDVKLTTGDPAIVQGTVDPNTYQAGSWNLEVVELAKKASAASNGFPDKDKTVLGTGYLRFETPQGQKDVYITTGHNTLEKAANAINIAKVGVHATVVNDRSDKDNPYRLVVSADGVGEDKSVKWPRIYMTDGDQDMFFEKEMPAKNGTIKLDGFEIQTDDNVLKDVIPGATLDLKQAAPGKPITLSVKEDIEVVSGKIKTFVDGMNGVLQFIQTQNKIDKATDTTKTLGGDSLIRTVEQRMRSLVQAPQYGVGSNVNTLNQLGISFNRNGLLDFDQKKFNNVLAANPEAVSKFFVGDGFQTGFVTAVKREVSNMLNPAFGPLSNRTKGLKEKIDQFDKRVEQQEKTLTKKEQILRDKFSHLEEQMSKIKAQGAQVGAMGGGGSLVGG